MDTDKHKPNTDVDATAKGGMAGEGDAAPATNWRIARRNLIAGVTLASGALLVAGRNAMAQTSTWMGTNPVLKPGPKPRPKCFLAGTRILTPAGEVDVAMLQPGDLVTTASGDVKPVLGIGHRSYTRPDGEAWDTAVLPIRIARNAISDGVPHADLLVSRTHAVMVDGLMVPAEDLLNGRSIVVADMAVSAEINYVHVEVEGHDVLVANGAHAETLQPEAATALAIAFDRFSALPAVAASESLRRAARAIPITGYHGQREILRSHVRSALAVVIDRRRPLDKVRDRLAVRADHLRAA